MNNINISNSIKVFKEGGIVIFPTDTAIGIGCRMDFVDSVKKIFEIRKRVDTKPLLILVDSMQMASEYALFTDKVRLFCDAHWPGGITVILPAKEDKVPGVVRAHGETIAIRIPKQKNLLEIISELGVPIVAPSANISGENTPYSLSEVKEEIIGKTNLVIEGECFYKKESTIIDTTKTPWQIVRQGAVKVEL